MSKIFELYGYRLDCWNEAAENNLKRVWCPFMDGECDGGGNRYLSALNARSNAKLRAKIKGKDIIQAGVCSLQIHGNEQPWIICPRRLLSLKNGTLSVYQLHIRKKLSAYSELDKTKTHKVWSEVKIKTEVSKDKYGDDDDDKTKSFDYMFDYVISATGRKKVADIASSLALSPESVRKTAEKNGYTVACRDTEYWIDDFPADPFIIIEVMTSSTSGGDKKKRTQIAMACEDAILNGMEHNAPGINYRQVWARMVSQLIVKSQVALAWNGRTIWLVQDVLADYISKSTALVLPEYLSEKLGEVNILAVSYGDAIRDKTAGVAGVIELKETQLYSGPISSSGDGEKTKGFIDIVKVGAVPPQTCLGKALLHKKPLGNWKFE
jgi:hypothetical protein